MLSFWICSLVLYIMISDVLAFTPINGNQCSSSLGLRTETKTIQRSYTNSYSDSRSMADQFERDFSRNLALPMATKLKYADDENSMTNTTVGLFSRVETLFPSTETLTIEMTEHVPLGCTVDESLHEEDDFIFISKLTTNGHAEEAGLQVGDVIVGVTGLFGELVSTIDVDIEKLKRLVSAVTKEDPLTIQVARGTNVLERHESTIVELCNGAGADEKAVQECVVEFIAGGYDYSNNADEGSNEDDETICGNDEDTECMIDGMMNLWADELPAPSTTTGITEKSVQKTAKPKPWSSRSSGSGTWVRDPKTGKMRNIDA